MSNERSTIVLIPAYEEEATIAKVIMQTRKYVSNVIVCDDGSKDLTAENAEAAGAIVTRHKTNLGKGAALRTLFTEAMKTGAEYVITLDADGQHEPSEIPQLIRAIRASRADVVVGSRFIRNRVNGGKIPRRRALGNKLLSLLTDGHISDTQSGFRIYRTAVLGLLMPKSMKMGADSEIIMKAREEGLKIVEVPINVKYDVPNPSKQNPFVTTSQVVLGVLRYLSARRPRLFYGVPAIAVLVIALGYWVRAAQMAAMTGQIQWDLAFVAIGITIISMILATIAIILLRFITITRNASTMKSAGHSSKTGISPETAKREKTATSEREA